MPAAAATMAPIKSPSLQSSQSPNQTIGIPPWQSDPSSQWLSVREFAQIYRRSERTIRVWCADGTLIEFGFSLYQDPGKKWWISATKLPAK